MILVGWLYRVHAFNNLLYAAFLEDKLMIFFMSPFLLLKIMSFTFILKFKFVILLKMSPIFPNLEMKN